MKARARARGGRDGTGATGGAGPTDGTGATGGAGSLGRMRRIPLAFVLLGILSLLSAGAVALGVWQAPTSADLAVHNGAGETLSASRVKGHYTSTSLQGIVISFAYVAPDKATEVAKDRTGKVRGRRSVNGVSALSVLQPVRQLLGITNFVQKGGDFVSTEPASSLVPLAQRAQVSGTYRTTVTLAGQYVVRVMLDLSAVDQGQRISQSVRYDLTRVGGWGSG